MTAPRFHFHDPTKSRLFACVACQKDMQVLCPRMFGPNTLVCLCSGCVRALSKKWPDVFDAPAVEATR